MDAPLFQEYGPGWYIGEEVENAVDRADRRIGREGRSSFSGFMESAKSGMQMNVLFIHHKMAEIELLFQKSIDKKMTIHTAAVRFVAEKMMTDSAFCRKLNEQAETIFEDFPALPEIQEFLTNMLVLSSKKTGAAPGAELLCNDPEMALHARDRRRFSDLPPEEKDRRIGIYMERFLSLVPQSKLAFFFMKAAGSDEDALASFLEKEIMANWKVFYREGFSSFMLFTTGKGYKLFVQSDWAKNNFQPISGRDIEFRGPQDMALRVYSFSEENRNSVFALNMTMLASAPRRYAGPPVSKHPCLRSGLAGAPSAAAKPGSGFRPAGR